MLFFYKIMCYNKRMKQPIPKFQIHSIHDMLNSSKTLSDFWITICEKGFLSLNRKFMIDALNIETNHINYVKYFKKLQTLDKSAIKPHLPKYIVVQKMNLILNDNSNSNKEILDMLDRVFGKNAVKINNSKPKIAQIEIWLNDEADLATLEFYCASHQNLFYY